MEEEVVPFWSHTLHCGCVWGIGSETISKDKRKEDSFKRRSLISR
jgi:hypothetical protein